MAPGRPPPTPPPVPGLDTSSRSSGDSDLAAAGLTEEMGTRLQFSSSTVDVVGSLSDFFLSTLKSRGCSVCCCCSLTGLERSYGASVCWTRPDSAGWPRPARSRKLSRSPIRANMGLTVPTPGNIGLDW